MALQVEPIMGTFGGKVTGIDPTLRLDDATFAQVEAAWYRHSILLFPGLTMSPEDQIAFTRRLGAMHIMEPLQYNLDGHPEIFVVSNAKENGREVGLRRAGMGFHTDGEDKVIPNAGSFLYALQLPDEGGDTMFADMYSAYDALPADIRARISGRRARFSRIDLHEVHYPLMPALTDLQKQQRPDVYHPLCRRHPESGRTALYVGRWAIDIEGLPKEEGREIITFLQRHAQEPRFVYRHKWRVGDAILWDNRCTQHCATGFDESLYVRRMHRTTLEGTVPIMADAAVAA